MRSNQTGAGNARILPGRGADGAVRDGVRCKDRHLMQYMNSRGEAAPSSPFGGIIRDKWFTNKGYKVIRITVAEFKKRYFSGQGFLDLMRV